MQELSMNILDIAQNSVRAGAGLVEIFLEHNSAQNQMALRIRDDGSGMDAEMVRQVTDPFCTTRTTRKVGLGVPLLKMAAEMTGGDFSIQSQPGEGTLVTATFQADHIDRMPLGDMGSTFSVLVQSNPQMDFTFQYNRDGKEFRFGTPDAREILGDVPLSEPSVAVFIRDYINQGIEAVQSGQDLPDNE